MSPRARRPEPAGAARRVVEAGDFGQRRALDGRGDELRNAVAAFDLEWLAAEIGKDDFHFAAIIAVDRAGRVEAGDAVL